MMVKQLVNLCEAKTSLSVPLLVNYYNQGLNDTQIADRVNCTQQGVSDYKLRHIDDIKPLIGNPDSYAALDSMYLAHLAKKKLKEIINTCETFDKKDLIPLTAVSDRHTSQSRLLSDKSTHNIHNKHSYQDKNASIDQAILDAQAELSTI